MRTSFNLSSPRLQVLIVAVLALLVYSNTFTVPFHYDDKLNIVDTARVKDLHTFWPPSGMRWSGYLTFALNYHFGGLDTTGYHAVNLLVHILNAFLVYWLVLLTFRTPYYAQEAAQTTGTERRKNALTALFAALLFAAHPVQTGAVTYIVQRFASLATFFYLLSLTTYVRARLIPLSPDRDDHHNGTKALAKWSLYAASLLAAVLAMATKEIAFTLPVVIILYEVFFLSSGSTRRVSVIKRILYLLPFLLTLAIIPLVITQFGTNLKNAFSATNEISRHDYLLTQFRVIVTYLRLLFFPVDQSISYDYPIYRTFADPAVLSSFLLLASLAGLGAVLFIRSRAFSHPARLISFGIFWFFITLSVESSIIPIADVIFEHRLYLPGVGASIAVTATAGWLVEVLQKRYRRAGTVVVAAGAIVVAVLGTAAFMRNTVWKSEFTLWEDAVKKYPGALQAQNMLGILYQAQGNSMEAMNAYRRALALNPSYAEAHVNLGSIYVDQGMLDEGMKEYMAALNLRSLDDIDTANLFINIGYCYLKKGLPDRAIEFYNYALPMVPGDATVPYFLGQAYRAKGMSGKAAEYFRTAHQLNPDRF
jgi:hypothetical protein